MTSSWKPESPVLTHVRQMATNSYKVYSQTRYAIRICKYAWNLGTVNRIYGWYRATFDLVGRCVCTAYNHR